MLRVKLLRNLLILALALVLVLPSYDFFFVHPAYHDHLSEETEREAVRYASYMLRSLGLEGQVLTRQRLPDGLAESLRPASRDEHLLKVRIFSPSGEIIYSTAADEIGTRNTNSYFHEVVAKGEVYSKVVHKDRRTAEGIPTKVDIVETYVPFMSAGSFGGAFEVYYDITDSVARVERLSFFSMIITLVMSLAFLLAIIYALHRVHASLQEREAAERALQAANEQLEQRVAERTLELTDANVQLTDQIAERIQAQTELRQALEDIRLDRERLDGILSSVPDGVVVADDSLQILHMNVAAEGILGKSMDEVIGQSIAALSDEVDFIRKIGQRLNLAMGGRPFDFELRQEKNRNPRVYQVRIAQFVPEGTKSPGIVLLIRDVTMERDIERMKNAFLGMAAHELNTPLTTIVGFTELLTARETADSFSPEQQREFLHLVHDKALALGGLIDDLLDISRVESGRPMILNYQDVRLEALVREVVGACERGGGHRFELLLPDGPVSLCADQQRLKQVIEHLVGNAVKFSPNGGVVQVALARHDGGCELTVSDQGVGMNEEQLAHVFDRFYRADSSDTAVKGVGLGMSIVRHVVLAHHGDIRVESQPGSGTRVHVSLPLAPPSGPAEHRLSAHPD